MTGKVDEAGRALLTIEIKHPTTGETSKVIAWIDTGFTGHLVFSTQQIASLGLPIAGTGRAILADGREVEIKTYKCELEWFGQHKVVEVIENEGQFPLLGVGLLQGHKLRIDYAHQQLELN